ncbi:NAD-dependent epimerase/dehydratase family protein [Aquimarina sp. D1M17]|uniref:NAD-dependent epimerase/dehydratase family protein n=1 Tax=Aquimarina acroporae TaxID=2937283 RepID=UPI0020C03CAE|nr:NAD-dependent epimerase/dehydratase family protein [Aquimarina acroporae]MCK8523513.1 NAD-dependent epimerase/dehydratase family protein [Aquimarina acroporae]
MKKIGVIGATGMLGHHVAKLIQSYPENELVVIHRETSNLSTISDLNYTSRVADLNNFESLNNAFKELDYVLNCAAYYPTVPKPLKEELKIANLQMKNFVNAITENNIKKALYLGGSIAIPKSENGIADEELRYKSTPGNRSAYVQVKWLMDKIARKAGKIGVPIVIGIPSMTFGEYDYGPSTGRIITNTVNQTLPGFVNGNRNVVYAGDAARGLILACLKGRVGERYLITGENISMAELIKKITLIGGISEMPRKIPLHVAKLVSKIKMTKYKLLGGELPLLNDTAIAVMSAGQFLNGEKAKIELGYEPKTNIDTTIKKTLDWFKSQNYIDTK